ncbi:MAG TPA: hypothetical protein PKW95_14375 [bacterium]|nr:hypothetical protein [bacterium]
MRLALWLTIGLLAVAILSGCTIQLRPDRQVEPEPPAEATPAPEDDTSDDFAPTQPPVDNGPDELDQFLADESARDQVDETNIVEDPPVEPEPEPEPPALVERNITPMPSQEALAPLDAGRLQAGGRASTTRRRAAIALIIEGHDLQAQDNAYLAEKRFERAMSVDPSCGEAYLALAELRFTQQQWGQAADLSTKAALRLGRDNYFLARAHLVAAKALVNDEQPAKALAQVEQALAAEPGNGEALRLQQELQAYLGKGR